MVLDYSMMQWVLSIVVGVSLSRFINTIALIGGKKNQVKLDFLLIPDGVRRRSTEIEEFWFNYNNKVVQTKIGEMKPADIIRLPRF